MTLKESLETKNMHINFKSLVAVFLLVFFSHPVFSKTGDLLKTLPIQDSGRVKPYDSFSKEMLKLVYGKSEYQGRPAFEVVLTWYLTPEAWEDKSIFELRNFQILEKMGLDPNQRYFKGSELFLNEKLLTLMQELQNKRESKEKLTPFYQALQRLESQYFVFQQLSTGRMLRFFPPQMGQGTQWLSLTELEDSEKEVFSQLAKNFALYVGAVSVQDKERSLAQGAALDKSVENLIQRAQAKNSEQYPSLKKMHIEVAYNDYHPFRLAYIAYLLSSILFLMVWIFKKQGFSKWAWSVAVVAFAFHTLGFGLRMYLTGRAPVTNMYETVIWVSWGSFLFAAILEKVYQFKFMIFAGTLLSFFALIIADVAPAVLDPTLQPLEAVLRSNFWLTIHVMTITISYAAFFLAYGLGNISLIYFARGEKEHGEKIKPLSLAIYRSLQIGVMFLAPGIILGGVWADYAWGRFWGWDPKEIWALIALLGYLALLHARIAGYVRDFGIAVASVLTFSLVIMAWYGVNFVLGAGLHSYGFGAGGVEYVSGYLFLQALFVLYVKLIRS